MNNSGTDLEREEAIAQRERIRRLYKGIYYSAEVQSVQESSGGEAKDSAWTRAVSGSGVLQTVSERDGEE